MSAEAYYKRKRYLYALFVMNAVYIGQSVNPHKRLKQHLLKSGGWNMSLHMEVLTSIEGTREDADFLERAYRLKAVRLGYKVFGKPHVFIDPNRQATFAQRIKSYRLPWPKNWRKGPQWRFPFGWLFLSVPVIGVLLALL